MKYSVKEFADKIRKQNPQKYGKISDSELLESYFKQFPNAREKIDFGKKSSNGSSGVGNIVLAILAIIGLFFIISKFNESNSSGQNQINNNSGIDTNTVVDNNHSSGTMNNTENSGSNNKLGTIYGFIQMTKNEADSVYNLITKTVNLNNEELDGLNILIYNSDPQNIAGNVCGTTEQRKCLWCGKEMNFDKVYTEINVSDILLYLDDPKSLKQKLIEVRENNGMECQLREMIKSYCSEKCRVESYEYDRSKRNY